MPLYKRACTTVLEELSLSCRPILPVLESFRNLVKKVDRIVQLESRNRHQLPTVQVVGTRALHPEEENPDQDIRGQSEERCGVVLKLDDQVRCPECSGRGRVIWVSPDGTRAAIRCQRLHSQIVRGPSILGSTVRTHTKPQKNMVFIVDTAKAPSAPVEG